jgi:LysR family nod box-dependent transcriptional activator
MIDPIRSLRTVNLNLLPILAELLRRRNVTHAASQLNLTQSTISGALRQLREIFDDEILVQRGREMHLTERARRLAPEVERLVELTSRLFQTEEFEPSISETNFRIATADYVSALIASQVGKTLQAQAPNVSLTLLPTPGSSAKSLRQGALDLIICPNRRANLEACGIGEDDADFGLEVFKLEDWVAIQWAGHPSAGRALSHEEYFYRPHAIYCRTDGRNTIEQDTLDDLGIHQKNRFFVPYFTMLPQIVVGSNLIGVVPESLANQYSKLFDIHVFRPPYKLPPLESAMIWARNREATSDLDWLRSVIRQVTS